jgi:hypothetical protein
MTHEQLITMSFGIIEEDYLGDGLYVAQDGQSGIILSANDKVSGHPTDTVYLDSEVIKALHRYLVHHGLAVKE